MKSNRRIIITLSITLLSIALLLLLAGCPGLFERKPATNSTPTTTVTIRDSADFMFPERISGLEQPIAFAFAPGRRIFITERNGQVRVFENGELIREPFVTVDVPDLSGYHETGLLGIAVDPNFDDQPYVYIYHTYEDDDRLFNRVARYRYGSNNPEAEVLLDRIPGGRIHNGGILKFGPDGNLFVSTGDSNNRNLAQNLNSTAGKILRMTPSGGVPQDNPFEDSPVYSYGHRNVFGLAFHPETGELYATENGPNRDDEVNKIQAGKNYGWPTVTGISSDERFIDPIVTYTPNIAPTQAIFYTGNIFRDIKNQLIFGSYNPNELHALELTGEDNTGVEEDSVIFRSDNPIIGVAEAPDGTIYVNGDNSIRRIQTLRISRFINSRDR